jgi:hypothetical protein
VFSACGFLTDCGYGSDASSLMNGFAIPGARPPGLEGLGARQSKRDVKLNMTHINPLPQLHPCKKRGRGHAVCLTMVFDYGMGSM